MAMAVVVYLYPVVSFTFCCILFGGRSQIDRPLKRIHLQLTHNRVTSAQQHTQTQQQQPKWQQQHNKVDGIISISNLDTLKSIRGPTLMESILLISKSPLLLAVARPPACRCITKTGTQEKFCLSSIRFPFSVKV